jgi:hypothetical protein
MARVGGSGSWEPGKRNSLRVSGLQRMPPGPKSGPGRRARSAPQLTAMAALAESARPSCRGRIDASSSRMNNCRSHIGSAIHSGSDAADRCRASSGPGGEHGRIRVDCPHRVRVRVGSGEGPEEHPQARGHLSRRCQRIRRSAFLDVSRSTPLGEGGALLDVRGLLERESTRGLPHGPWHEDANHQCAPRNAKRATRL